MFQTHFVDSDTSGARCGHY